MTCSIVCQLILSPVARKIGDKSRCTLVQPCSSCHFLYDHSMVKRALRLPMHVNKSDLYRSQDLTLQPVIDGEKERKNRLSD